MKKKILLTILIMIVGVLFVGCNKENKKNDNSSWVINLDVSKQELDNNVKKVFEDAKANYSGNLDYIALLGKQVVAGTNYMFLCKDETGFKVAIVYRNLEGVSQITNVSVFDPVKYVNEDISYNQEQLAGGWYTEVPVWINGLNSNVQKYFQEATEKLVGVKYSPIGVLAEQYKVGINYAVLCYGQPSYQGALPGIYMLTLYADKTNKAEIVSIAAINLADFNK